MTTYPLSPPSSTSLPEHWSFPSTSASVPPVTDGPNTRARLAVGLEPLSGGTGPAPLSRAAERTDDHQHCSEARVLQAWVDHQKYPSPHAPSNNTETYYAIDPTLERCYHQPPAHPRPPFSEYGRQGCRRHFSTATFIDHGSPPASPTPSFAPAHVVSTDETVLYASHGHGHGHGGVVASLGLTKEEWLRLGGFLDGEEGDVSVQPPLAPTLPATLPSFPPQYTPDLRERAPAIVPDSIAAADDDADEHLALPIPPPLLPSPTLDVAATPMSTPTPMAMGGPFQLPPAQHPASMLPPALPLPAPRALPPPMRFSDTFLEQQQQPAPLIVGQTPTRSQRRRAPSPIQAVRAAARPAPYPPTVTVSRSNRDDADDHAAPAVGDIAVPPATTTPTGVVEPPASLLTPIRAALAKYPEIPLPAVPPSPLPPPPGKKKKRHGRKMSADHIPRPRNAFILFRSHAITSGLIPRSIGVKDHKNISQIVGGVWRGLSEVERQQWEELAEEEKRRHLAKYPNYAYRPKQTDKPRAAPGYGKKAKAKAARLAVEYAELTGTDLQEAERYFLAQQQQQALVRSGTNSSLGDDDDGSSASLLPVPPVPLPPLQDPHKRREERRMALIAQALLEGEQDDRVLQRVELQLEAEMGPAPAAPEPSTTSREEDIPVVEGLPPTTTSQPTVLGKKAKAKTTLTTPSRRTRSSSARGAANVPGTEQDETTPTKQQQQPLPPSKRAMYASPAGSSTGSTQLSPSPFRRSAVSPASSDSPSPSPLRMQSMPMSRGGGGSSSSTSRSRSCSRSRSRKHPLSRSQSATTPEEEEEQDGGEYASDDLPAARRQKTSSYGVLGVSSTTAADPTSGYTFPPTRHSGPTTTTTTTDVPLFAGPTDSRNFSLGRWELRKPSAAVTSRREMLARQVEEQEQEREEEGRAEGAWVHSATEATIAPSPFLLNSSEFLFEAGLEPLLPPPTGATGLVDPRATVLQLPPPPPPSCAGVTDPHDDAGTEYGTAYSSSSVFDASWQSDAASSNVYYDTAPSSSSARSPTRMTMPADASGSFASKDPYGLFRPHQPIWSAASVGPSLFAAQQQHHNGQHFAGGGLEEYEPLSATPTAGGGASPRHQEEDLFHFGAEDLFAPPPPALSLFDHDPSTRTISSMFDPTSPGAAIGDERFGLGIALAP